MNRERRLRVLGYVSIGLGIFPLVIGGLFTQGVIGEVWSVLTPDTERHFYGGLVLGGGLLIVSGAILRYYGDEPKES
jgi:hypothetical protein